MTGRPSRPPALRSLRNKLALLFFAITAAAFSVIYFYVVPQLESNLRDKKLDDLSRAAASSEVTLEALMGRRDIPARVLDRRVRSVADAAGARVTLLGRQRASAASTERSFYVITDSREQREVPLNPALAARAAATGELARGRGSLGREELGEIAQPLTYRGRVF